MIDYIIIGILVIIVIILIILLFKGNSKNDVERIVRLENNLTKEIGEFKLNFTRDLQGSFDKLDNKIEYKLNLINDRVNSKLDETFEKSNKTFMNVLERLNRIDEAQKKIDGLSSEIVSLQSVLTDKKTRGTFGEVNLEYILNNAFGSNNSGIYSIQHKMGNGSIVDCLLYAPAPLGTIAIDSKFPLENYQRMVDKNRSKEERVIFEKNFVADVKKHITDISEKYIIPGETSDEAIMFLPAEAIFAEINAYHPELINYAYQKKVWITGPTTLISTLSIISMVLKNMERDKYAKVIHEELERLGVEFGRYKERWDKLSRSVKTVNQSIDELHTTTEKITKRFESIKNANIKEIKNNNLEEIEYRDE